MATGSFRNISDLRKSTDARDLIDHHRTVTDYYEPYNKKRAKYHDFVRGKQWSDAEEKAFKDKNKTPIVLNKIKAAERTFLGQHIQSKFDISWAPRKKTNQDMSQVMEQLRIWEAHQQNDHYNDVSLLRRAWAGGSSFQECWMDVQPGAEPRMRSQNVNSFASYPDPESRRPITREDAEFWDIDTWMSEEQLYEYFPDKHDLFRAQLRPNLNELASGYEHTKVYKDQSHIDDEQRNGKYLVTERFYKVYRSNQYIMDEHGEKKYLNRKEVRKFKPAYEGQKIGSEHKTELWLAVVCEAASINTYLFNGKYHCQPRNPYTDDIIYPILEMVAEDLEGETSGFVEHMVDPQRAYNALSANVLTSAKHAASQSKLIDFSAFESERDARDCARNSSDADRAFRVKQGRGKDALTPIEHRQVSQDNQIGIGLSSETLQEVSSTPPSMQGFKEGNESGVLNAQRIEQANIQLQVFRTNYAMFLRQRILLRYAYWRQYYTNEKIIRIVEPTPEQAQQIAQGTAESFVTINEKVPATDMFGNVIPNEITILNNINDMIYDVEIVESKHSGSYRLKIQQQISEMMQAPAATQNPQMVETMWNEWVALSDMRAETKAKISSQAQQQDQRQVQEQQAAEQEQMRQQVEMQRLQLEAQKQKLEAQKLQLEGQKTQADIVNKNAQTQMDVATTQMDLKKGDQDLRLGEENIDQVRLENLELKQKIAQMEAEQTAGISESGYQQSPT